MNTKIQDALNLAWKLALVLRGAAKPELLDSYNAERHANARRLLARVGPATKMVGLRHPVAIEVRNWPTTSSASWAFLMQCHGS
jgi:2-polyprenyl-6-methoxyphenol hydroxylase-like FAD-dependent oxidoreductase